MGRTESTIFEENVLFILLIRIISLMILCIGFQNRSDPLNLNYSALMHVVSESKKVCNYF